jgi:hypothetical protein
LVVVSVESDGPAALAVASTAVDLVSEGRSVLVVDLSKTSALASVFSVPKDKTSTLHFGEAAHAVAVAVPAVPLVDGDDGPTANSELASLRRDADVVLVLATSDPAAGAWHLVRWGTTAVAVVTAGRSTAAALGSTAQLARAAGLKVDSAVLVGTDPDDDTAGLADLPASTFPVDAAHREPAP